MEDTVNCELTRVKDEPSVCKKEPIGRCDDLVNEFVDYTMVSVPITEISQMDNTSFIDSITQSMSKQVEKSKQVDTPPDELMDVDENTDIQETSPIEGSSETTAIETVPSTRKSPTSPPAEDPSSSETNNEVSVDTNVKNDDVVMLLSDSEDEDKSKTDVQVDDAEMVEKASNDEITSEVANTTVSGDKAETETNSTDIVEADSNDMDRSVITLDDSPENSEVEAQKNVVSSEPKSSGVEGE